MSLQYDRRVSSEVAADCQTELDTHISVLHFFPRTQRERHIHLAFEPKLHCEIPCLDAPADRHRLGQLTCPSTLPPSPRRAVSRPSIVGNICGSRRQCTLINSEALTPSHLFLLSHTRLPPFSQSVNQLASRLAISESPVKLSSGRCELAAALAKLDEVPCKCGEEARQRGRLN